MKKDTLELLLQMISNQITFNQRLITLLSEENLKISKQLDIITKTLKS